MQNNNVKQKRSELIYVTNDVLDVMSKDKVGDYLMPHIKDVFKTISTLGLSNDPDKYSISSTYRIDEGKTLMIRTSLGYELTFVGFADDSFEDKYKDILNIVKKLRAIRETIRLTDTNRKE